MIPLGHLFARQVIASNRVSTEPYRRLSLLGLAVTLAAVSGASCRRAQPPTTPASDAGERDVWFEEVAEEVGLVFSVVPYRVQRFYMPEEMPGGIALFDYDLDGDLDVYLGQGGDIDDPPNSEIGNRLFRNGGDGTFEDVTDEAGVGDPRYMMGCACGDYDGDGDVDLFITNLGSNVLYRNNGDGTFTDVTEEAGVSTVAWGVSCVFVDYDGDDDLDIFVTNYLNWSPERELECLGPGDRRDYCAPGSYQAPAPDTLFRNNGNGTFTDISKSAGLRAAFGTGLGVAVGDFDSDGRVDIYVANDQTANQLWLNAGNGTFKDAALLSGCALSGMGKAEASMGVMAVDFENDGDSDLFLSHLRNETNTFYLNRAGMFDDTTSQLGLGTPSMPFTGFGLGFADFDHDGVLDLYVANGRVKLDVPTPDPSRPYAEPNQLFRGRVATVGVRFDEVLPRGGTKTLLVETSRAAAFGDLDNDGDIDIVVSNFDGRVHVLRNIAGSRGNWIMFRVINARGMNAIGASVRVTADGAKQWRTVQRAYSDCASKDPRVHFGLGNAKTVQEILVRWTGGREEVFSPLRPGSIHVLREGGGQPADRG